MDHLNFAEFDNGEIININKITRIIFDEIINKYAISIEGEPNPTMIDIEQYNKFVEHLKKTSRSYFKQ